MLTYNLNRRRQWDKVHAKNSPLAFYHTLLERKYRFLIPSGLRVLELGCGDGSLLAAVKPVLGVGIDFSAAAVARAKREHPELLIVRADAHALPMQTQFDVIILSDLINDLWDVQRVFQILANYSHSRTRIILNSYSRLWQIPLDWAEKLGLKNRTLEQNWFTVEDIQNLYKLTDYEQIKHETEILLPVYIPVLSALANQILVRFWPFNLLALTNFLVARALKPARTRSNHPSVSIVIPARNEAGNIEKIFQGLPKLSDVTELIFVEGHSKDDTYQRIEQAISQHPQQKATLLKQKGIGKADAVWEGFAAAKNDILVILDADLSVDPQDLGRFLEAATTNKGEFINGSRLVYPMENQAMQFANLVGNKLFSLIFSWLLSQPIKDTLCGTKVLWREDYEQLRKIWPFRKIDPFGDFDLLLGATKLNLKIIDIPIRYHQRTYGSTNISRWKHGWGLLRMTLAAARRIKFRQ
jgi:SAM-dependent methyltransferase